MKLYKMKFMKKNDIFSSVLWQQWIEGEDSRETAIAFFYDFIEKGLAKKTLSPIYGNKNDYFGFNVDDTAKLIIVERCIETKEEIEIHSSIQNFKQLQLF